MQLSNNATAILSSKCVSQSVGEKLAIRMVVCTWLGDHQGRRSAPTNSLHKLNYMARYQVLLTITITFTGDNKK